MLIVAHLETSEVCQNGQLYGRSSVPWPELSDLGDKKEGAVARQVTLQTADNIENLSY